MELNVQRGAIPVDLDRQRTLIFDHAATWLLIQRYGPRFITELYRVKEGNRFELVSMDALAYFLWAGLQRDAKQRGEELTLVQAADFLRPWNYNQIFERVIFAVVGATATPAMLATGAQGKGSADGEAAKPAAGTKAAPQQPGPTKVMTSMKRSVSPTRSSAGRRTSSGSRRRAS
jgi:hypothetical protein